MKLKICGMKHEENIARIAELQPDFLGFIFHENSPRHFVNTMPHLPNSISKVGVFVNKNIEFIEDKINTFNLQLVQLHGNESPEFCNKLQAQNIKIIKVFSIKDEFDFSLLQPYEEVCDFFLFDTKGRLPGGNGYTFNWSILNNYSSSKPYFLSGGIGLHHLNELKTFKNTEASKYCYALDINSQFEIEPGLKSYDHVEKFKSQL